MMSPNWMKKQNLSKHRLAKNNAISSITLTKNCARIWQNELESKVTLISFVQRYPDMATMANVDNILANLWKKKQSENSLFHMIPKITDTVCYYSDIVA